MNKTITELERELSDLLTHRRRLQALLHASKKSKVTVAVETDWMTLLSRIEKIIGSWAKRRTTQRVSHLRQQPPAPIAMEQEKPPTAQHGGPPPRQPRERRRSRPDAEKREHLEALKREWDAQHRRDDKTSEPDH